MRIRKTTPTDVDAVFSLATEFATSFEVDKRPFLESLHQVMSDDHVLLLVAAEGEEVVGYCLGFAHDTFFANGRVAWVEEIMVSSPHRKKGVGRSMLMLVRHRFVEREPSRLLEIDISDVPQAT